MSNERRNWICSTIDVPGGATAASASTIRQTDMLEGMAERSKLWPHGKALRVRFLSGAPALHTRVLQAARAWLQPGVQLDIVPADKADKAELRISFEAGGGSWSAVGIDSLLYHPSQPTMNLGWATLDTPERDFSSVVIHEFGHALGLLHEHNHPEAGIRWNKPAVNADLSGDPNWWDQDTIDSNVFAPYAKSDVITTKFDASSVMIYTIPAHWTVNGQAFMPSWELSAGDQATIRALYA